MRVIIMLLLIVLMSGCGFPFGETSPRHYVALPVPPADTIHNNSRSGILALRPLRAAAFLESDRIAFSKSDIIRGYYQHTFWNEIPSLAITRMLIERFEAKGNFLYVTKSYEASAAEYSLVAELLELQHLAAEDPGEALVELRAELYSRNANQLIGVKKFSARSALQSYDAEGAAYALGQATDQLLNDLVSWVNDTVQLAVKK